MPWLLGLVTMLVTSTAIRAVIVRVAIALGISVLTYTGVSVGIGAIFAAASSSLGSVGSDALSILSLCKVPQALNVIASAYTSALALRGLTGSGVLKRITWGGAGSVVSGT